MYALFLKENCEFFDEEGFVRSGKIFKRMSEYLDNGRNNGKCRSHHQKMIRSYSSISSIINSILILKEPECPIDDSDVFSE